MQPGKPIVGEDIVVFLNRETGKALVTFRYETSDVNGQAGVYLIRNNISRKLLERISIESNINDSEKEYSLEINKEDYYIKFRDTYPLFKIRIEMLDNSRIFMETNEFKVVVY